MKDKMNNNRSLTLIEVMIAILLIALVSSAIIVLFPQALLIGDKGNKIITAVNLAQARLEYAESLYSFRDLHQLVETDTIYTVSDNSFKRTTVVGYQIDSVGTNTITDSDQSWAIAPEEEWIYYTLTIASGSAKGKHYQISDNTATTITCDGANFVSDGVAAGDYYYITLAPVKVTVAYKISIEEKITPHKIDAGSTDIGLKDTPAGADYQYYATGKWQDVELQTIFVQNEAP